MKFTVLALSLMSFFSVSNSFAQMNSEVIPASEAADVTRATEMILKKLADEHNQTPSSPIRRDAHPKAHGCLKAEFTVLSDVPKILKKGLFAEPHTYKAWIRYSNGLPPASRPDRSPDARGMAIKVMGVTGPKLLENDERETQDFVMINYPAFIVGNVKDYIAFREDKKKFLLTHPHNAYVTLSTALQLTKNPMHTNYWSQSPFLVGPEVAAKFKVKAVGCDGRALPEDPFPNLLNANYLQQAMISSLAENDACYEFQIQPQIDAVKTPIEDASVSWDDAGAPFFTVAYVRIHRDVNYKFLGDSNQERTQFCENISYTPWHGLVEHRPLGGINRSRRAAYKAVSDLRHQVNGTKIFEPTGDEQF